MATTDSTANVRSAEVKTLVAEVKVLMVGSRQITLSVFRQLDCIDISFCEPMGRVNESDGQWVIGRDSRTGALARSDIYKNYPRHRPGDFHKMHSLQTHARMPLTQDQEAELQDLINRDKEIRDASEQIKSEYQELPLIVLAGLK